MTPHIRLLLRCAISILLSALHPRKVPVINRVLLGVLLFVGFTGVFYTRTHTPTHVYAAASSTLNFQARLSSAAGGIVPDGNYSVQFNLYNVSSGGTTQWTETQGTVQVKSGYLSVYLGSSTPFPSTIDWSQEQWLTMNVNGDGEMTPRLRLTAVPFAFQAQNALGVSSFNTTTPSTASGNVLIATGNATGATSNSGNLTVDTGTATGTTGTITIAGSNASALTLGRSGLQTTIAGTAVVQGGALNLGTTTQAGSLQLSDGSSNTVTLNASGVGTSYSLTLPTNAPTTDQCLRTDVTVASQLAFGNCGSRKVQQTYNTYSINQAATATTAQGYLLPTTATAFSIALAGTTEVRMTRAGSFRSCSIFNSAAVTGGSVSVRFRKNGANVSANNYCTLTNTTPRSNSQDIDPGIETFSAGDTIGIALVSTTLAPATLEHWVSFTVEFGTGSDNGIFNLQDSYNNSTGPEMILDSVRGGLTVQDNATPIIGSLLEVQNNGGGTTYFSVASTGITSSNALTVQNGGANVTGGLVLNSGSVTGVGTNITGTGAVTLASGGAGALTLDSASNTLILAANDTGAQRTAAGTYTYDLNDAADTTFAINNSGTGLAGLDVEGGITAGVNNTFSVDNDGDITSVFTQLNGTSTANGAGAASTSLVLANAANFDIGNYVQVNSANCGGAGVNPCYAKITNKVVNTLTITPALTWANASTVNEFHVPEIGATNTAQPLANRYGRGYFISGIAAGNGTTFYTEEGISTSLTTFDLVNTGVTTLNIGGAATNVTIGTAGTNVNVAGSLNVGGTTIVNSSGALTNISSVDGPGALTISSGGAGDIILDSASNKLVIDSTDTTLQRVGTGAYNVDLSDAATTTLTLNNSGAGTADLNLSDGGLQVAGTTVLTNGRVLQNVTANTSIFTSGTLGNARGGTGLDTSAASNGQLLIGNGTGFTLGSVANNGGLTVTPGAGTLGVSVNYGSTANTAVQGNVSLTCPSGSGNLTGGGTAITLGTGGTCAALSIVNNPAFTTSVTSPVFTGTGAVALSSGGAGDLSLTSASGVLNLNASTLRRNAAGTTTLDLSDAANTVYALSNSGAGAADLNLADGGLQIGGTIVLTNSRVLQNVTIAGGSVSSGTVSAANGGTGLNASAAANGQLLIGNGTGFALGTLANGGGLTINAGAGTLSAAVNYGSTANTAVQGNTALTITAGTGLTGGGTITLGSGGTSTLNVSYGSSANTAVQGNVTLTCPSGSGNLSGGGTAITLGTGGTCAALTMVNNPAFTTSVTSPLFTGAGAVTLSSGGAGDLTLDSASNKLVIGGTDTNIQRTAAGAFTFDLSDAANTTFTINNTGAGAANLNLTDGGIQVAGTQILTNGRAVSNLTGLSSSGTVTFSALAAGGLVRADASGNLAIATAGTDYENPLTFTNGLTRTTNTVRLGGNLTAATDVGLNGNAFTITGSGSGLITALAAGGLSVRAASTTAVQVTNVAGLAFFTVNTSGNTVNVGSSTSDATAILAVLDSYNTAGDPAGGVNGAQYYNSANNKFRCFENGAWTNCITPYPQVLVEATRTTALAPTTTATALPFPTATTNVGTAYNTTTGIFTAPAAGTYDITANVTMQMPTGVTGTRNEYFIDIFNVTGAAVMQMSYKGDSNDSGGTGFNSTSTITRTVTLTAGQQISVRIAVTTAAAGRTLLTTAGANTLQVVRVR